MEAKGVALTGADPALDAEEAALLTVLGQAHHGTTGTQGLTAVVSTLTRAFNYYVESGDPERAVAIAASDLPLNAGIELVEKALGLVDLESHDAGLLQARYITPQRAQYDQAQNAFHSAMAIANLHQDPALKMRTLVAGACVDFTNCQFEQSLERNLRALELAGQVDLPDEEAHARYDLMHVLCARGELNEAARHASEIFDLANRSGTLLSKIRALEGNEQLHSAMGKWQTARQFSDQGLAASPREVMLLGCRALLEYQVGDFEAGEAYFARMIEGFPLDPLIPYTLTDAFPWHTVPATVIPLVVSQT